MRKFFKKRPGTRMLSIALSLLLAVTLLPDAPAFAASPAAGSDLYHSVASNNATLAIDSNGDVWAWGYNGGEPGGTYNDGSGDTYPPIEGILNVTSEYVEHVTMPEKVKGISDVKSVAISGSLYLAIKNDDTLWIWGRGGNYGNGDGTTDAIYAPKKLMDGVKAVEAGRNGTYVLKSDGTVWSWGYNSSYGDLGHGSAEDGYDPTAKQIQSLSNVVDIATGYDHIFALKSDGTLMGWGGNGGSNLLLQNDTLSGEIVKCLTPVVVTNANFSSGIAAIDAGASFSMVLLSDGTVWTWGTNTYGQLGNGSDDSGLQPPAKILDGVAQIAASQSNGYALKDDGTLWSWGHNDDGQLGIGYEGEENPTPAQVMSEVTEISDSPMQSTTRIAVKSGEQGNYIWAWGYNERYTIGNGSNTSQSTPVRVEIAENLPNFTAAPILGTPTATETAPGSGLGTVDLSWSASNPAPDSYAVSYKAVDGNYAVLSTTPDGNGVKLTSAVTTDTTAKVEGLTAGADYTFKVTAKKTGLRDTDSNEQNAAIPSSKTPVGAPQNLAWDATTLGKATFAAPTDMTNITGYEISLYKNDELVDGSTQTLATSTLEYDYTSLITEAGSYTFQLKSKVAENDPDRIDSAAVISSAYNFIVKLAAPENLTFTTDSGVAGWDTVTGAGNYTVQLLKGSTAEGDPITVAGNSYDFLAAMKTAGAGTYIFSVVAKGDGVNYSDSDKATSTANFIMRGIADNAELPDEVLVKGDDGYELPSTVDFGDITNVKVTWNNVLSTASAGMFEFEGTPVDLPNDLTADGNVANLTVYVLDVMTDKDKLYLNMSSEVNGSNVGKVKATLLPAEYLETPEYLWTVTMTSGASIEATFRETDTATFTASGVGNHTAMVTITAEEDKSVTKAVEIIVTQNELTQLATPTDLSFDVNGLSVWEAVYEAKGYGVQLYRNDAPFGDIVETSDTSYDFLDIMREGGTGSYSFTVIARGNNETTMDSEPGDSDTFEIESIVLFEALNAITGIETGTEQANANLPSTVTANLSGGGTADIPVTWSDWDSSAAQTITLTGTAGELPINIINPGNVTVPTLNVTFVPKANIYTITFDANGGTVSTASASTGADGKLASLPTPTRTGNYRFDGWFTAASGGTAITTSTVFTVSGTIYAHWTYTGGGGGNNGGGGGGGGNGGGGNTPSNPPNTTTPSENAPQIDINGGNFGVTENADGSVDITLAESDVTSNLGEDNELTITVADSDDISLSLPISALNESSLRVVTDFGVAYFPTNILQTLSERYGDTLRLSIRRGSFIVELLADGKSIAYSDPANPFTVTLPYSLISGQKANAVVAVKKDGGNTILPFAVYKSGEATFNVTSTGTYDLIYNAKTFGDTAGHWANDNIMFASAREIFAGTEGGNFSPNNSMTRAMFATVLANLDGADMHGYNNSRFSDVPTGQWYSASVEWAADNGIVGGYDGKFEPNASVTREQMAVMLSNYIDYKKLSLQTGASSEFTDSGSISSWAKGSVDAMQKAGIISGKLGNTFDPQGEATRAEVATIFARFVENVAR